MITVMWAIRLAKCSFSKFHEGHMRIVCFELFIEIDPRTSLRSTSKISISSKFLQLLKVIMNTECAGRCDGFSLWTFFSGQQSFPNIILPIFVLKVKSPVLSVMAVLSPFSFISGCLSDTVVLDWRSDAMQDFTGLSLANTSRSWRGLWITSHCSFPPWVSMSRLGFQSEAAEHNKKTWSFYISMQDCSHGNEAEATWRTHTAIEGICSSAEQYKPTLVVCCRIYLHEMPMRCF